MKRHSSIGWAVLLLAGGFAGTLHADIMVHDAKANIIYQYSNGVMYEGRAGNNKKLFKYDAQRKEIWSLDGKKLAFWNSCFQ